MASTKEIVSRIMRIMPEHSMRPIAYSYRNNLVALVRRENPLATPEGITRAQRREWKRMEAMNNGV